MKNVLDKRKIEENRTDTEIFSACSTARTSKYKLLYNSESDANILDSVA